MNDEILNGKNSEDIKLILNKLNIEQLEDLMIKQAKINLGLKKQLKVEEE